MNSQIRFFIQILGSIGCFWWLFKMVSPEQLLDSLKKSSYVSVVLLIAIMVPAVLTRAWRWHYLLIRGGTPVSFASITKATFIGMALNLLLPASAGDVVRSYYSWQKYGHKEVMLASTLADKAVALISLFLLGAVGGFLCGEIKLTLLAVILIVPTAFMLIVPVRWLWNFLALLVNRVLKKDLDVDLLLRSFHMSIPTFFGAMFISIVGWLVTNLMYFIALLSVGTHVGIGYIFAIAPSINILRMLPLSISGLGSADALMVQMLGGVGIEKHLALAASMIVNLTLIIIPGLIGAVLMLLNARSLNKAVILKQTVSDADSY